MVSRGIDSGLGVFILIKKFTPAIYLEIKWVKSIEQLYKGVDALTNNT